MFYQDIFRLPAHYQGVWAQHRQVGKETGAEQELTFCEKNHIRCLTLNDEGYPGRLRECDDAPLALFYRGNADLNALHVINMVGTRHATPYGRDNLHHLR